VSDGKLVDVADVPRGKKCGCICPSCKTPLIARQGVQKEWHFAHASRAVYSETKSECEFSFYVSVRLMARQLIGDRLSIKLPEYRDHIDKYLADSDQWISIAFTVTEQQTLALSAVEVEKTFAGVPVDVHGKVNGFSFVIYFTHPGREVPPELCSPNTSKCGIIAISLSGLSRLFGSWRESTHSYYALLSEYLENDIASKRWIYHPRYKGCREKARQELQQKALAPQRPYNVPRTIPEGSSIAPMARDNSLAIEATAQPPKRLARFECVVCHTTWQDWVPGGNACPRCDTHLYSVLKEYLDET
jgi:hypothetical protein